MLIIANTANAHLKAGKLHHWMQANSTSDYLLCQFWIIALRQSPWRLR